MYVISVVVAMISQHVNADESIINLDAKIYENVVKNGPDIPNAVRDFLAHRADNVETKMTPIPQGYLLKDLECWNFYRGCKAVDAFCLEHSENIYMSLNVQDMACHIVKLTRS